MIDSEFLKTCLPCAICTIPRSGTWYVHYFFEFFDSILTNRSEIRREHYQILYSSMKIYKFHVHSIFPGFIEEYHGRYREKWDRLKFHHDGANSGYQMFSQARDIYYPSNNRIVRIVFIYRNPFDQAVSLFQTRENGNSDVFYYEKKGGSHPAENPGEFIRFIGIQSYIKQFFTFHAMKDKYSKNLLMIPYENLVRNPEAVFKSILHFFECDLNGQRKEKAFRAALNLSSMDSLKQIEQTSGRSIGSNKPGSHIHGGEIGKWKRYIRPQDLEYCEDRLNEFGLTSNDFITE